MAPLFAGYSPPVSTLLSLDGGPSTWVDLSAPDTSRKRRGSKEYGKSRRAPVELGYGYRWSQTGLENRTHTLVISPGISASGQTGTWGIVDGLV